MLPAQAGVAHRQGGGDRVPVVLPAQAGVAPGLGQSAGRRRCAPAQAGVAPTRPDGGTGCSRAPRSGGGGPWPVNTRSKAKKCSPLRRGWPLHGAEAEFLAVVLPAQAGVAPFETARVFFGASCSPLRRGWPQQGWCTRHCRRVLPAQAGVAPAWGRGRVPGRSAPRSGGGGPYRAPYAAVAVAVSCSPLRRGWPQRGPQRPVHRQVLPAQAGWPQAHGPGFGVFPVLPAQAGVAPHADDPVHVLRRAPRSGGGGPWEDIELERSTQCSPLRRGWPGPHPVDVDGAEVCSPLRRGWPRIVVSVLGWSPCSPLRRGWGGISNGAGSSAKRPLALAAGQ